MSSHRIRLLIATAVCLVVAIFYILVGLRSPRTLRVETPLPKYQSPYGAIKADAEQLAASTGMSLARAIGALRLQEESGGVVSDLREEFGDRVAGIYVDYDPTYRIFVRLKGAGKVEPRTRHFPAGNLQVTFVEGAKASIAELVDAMRRNTDAIRALLPTLQGTGVDERTGEAVVTIFAENSTARLKILEKRAKLGEIVGQPIRMEVTNSRLQQSDGESGSIAGESASSNGVRGGDGIGYGGINFCTTGFSVKNDVTGDIGIITAGHCKESYDVQYKLQDGSFADLKEVVSIKDANTDVEVLVSKHTYLPEFYADDDGKIVNQVRRSRLRADIAAGSRMCHRGIATGQSCGRVSQTNHKPVFEEPEQCGWEGATPVPCADTWIVVSDVEVDGFVQSVDCDGGDSGGPVFLGQTAYGIHKAGYHNKITKECEDIVVMPLDYLPESWSILIDKACKKP